MSWQDIMKYQPSHPLLKEIEEVVEDLRKTANKVLSGIIHRKVPFLLERMLDRFKKHYSYAKDAAHEGSEEVARQHLKEMKLIVEDVKRLGDSKLKKK